MTNRYFKIFILTFSIVLLKDFAANSQTITKSEEFSKFNSIKANESFNILLRDSTDYVVKWTVNKNLSDYVEVYVTGKVLHIEYNKKALSKELKNQYKGKYAPKQTFDITIYAPTVSEISLTDKVIMRYYGKGIATENFILNLTGNSRLDFINVISESANINLSKGSSATLKLKSEDIVASTSNSSSLIMDQIADKMTVTSNGSSRIEADGTMEEVNTNSQGSSNIVLKGNTKKIDIQSTGFSKQDLSELEAKKAHTHINGSSNVIVNASEVLSVEIRNAKLHFMNDSVIEVVSINNGTLLHYDK